MWVLSSLALRVGVVCDLSAVAGDSEQSRERSLLSSLALRVGVASLALRVGVASLALRVGVRGCQSVTLPVATHSTDRQMSCFMVGFSMAL